MSSDKDTVLTTCRLRTGLVEDCLLKILEKLNDVDLIQMSKVHDYFKNLIKKWIIGKKLCNLRELSNANKNEILETFGKSMVKFTINEINLNNFLDTVMKYCSPATLADVDLKLKEVATVDLDKIELSMPFFTRLYNIKLNVVYCDGDHRFNDFLKRLLEAAANLHSLHLYQVNMIGVWFGRNEMQSLRELRLIESYFLCSDTLNRFISSLPNLETFMYKGKKDITFIGSTFATCCPKLKNFADIHSPISDCHERVNLHRYSFLSSFSQLNYITLTSYTLCGSDLFRPLVELASKGIQKLRIFVDFEFAVAYSGTDRKRIMRASFAEFRSLRELEVRVQNPLVPADLQCDFILKFASQLKNLDTFSLKSSGKLTNVKKILERLPQINKLSISKALLKHLPVEIRNIVRTLRKIRQAVKPYGKRKLLKLAVDIEQWRELQVYKDINNLTEIILDPTLELHNHERNDLAFSW